MKTLKITLLVTTLIAYSSLGAMESALGKGDIPEIKRLLKAGFDPNRPFDRTGLLPYRFIISFHPDYKDRLQSLSNSLEYAKALLEAGADPNKISQGENALFTVARMYSPSMDANKPRHSAIIKEIAQLMLKYGADLKHQKPSGITPLHEAAMGGNLELVKWLIANGADVNAGADKGVTPLLYLVKFGIKKNSPNFHEIMYVLLKNGADPKIKDRDGKDMEYFVTADKLQRVYNRLKQAKK